MIGDGTFRVMGKRWLMSAESYQEFRRVDFGWWLDVGFGASSNLVAGCGPRIIPSLLVSTRRKGQALHGILWKMRFFGGRGSCLLSSLRRSGGHGGSSSTTGWELVSSASTAATTGSSVVGCCSAANG